MQSMSIDEAIERQRAVGSTSAQHQTTDSGEFIRRASADARASLEASRARGPADPATGLHAIDLSHVAPEHVAGISAAVAPAIKRATSRVGALFPMAAAHFMALEKALKEEIAVEFWNMSNAVHRDYEGLRDEVRGDLGLAADTTGSAGTLSSTFPVSSGGVVSGGGTSGTMGDVDSGGSATSSATISAPPPVSSATVSSGTVDSAGSVTSAGTVVNTGTVENAGTAGA